MSAFQDIIPPDSFPMYVLFIDLDPAQVDVNVHPTKQEIKFEDEKIVYAFVQAAVKHALAQFSITPTLDFDLDASIQQLDSIQQPFTDERRSTAQSSSIFQTFTEANQAHKIDLDKSSNFTSWKDTGLSTHAPTQQKPWVSVLAQSMQSEMMHESDISQAPFSIPEEIKPVQIFQTYILVPYAQQFYLIHQQAAHERIVYEKLVQAVNQKPIATQQSLFPSTLELTPADAVLIQELVPDLQKMGYTIEPFGQTTFVIQGTPADIESGNETKILESVLEQYKHFSSELRLSTREKLLRCVAWQQAVKPGISLTTVEMQALARDLFSCATPNAAPNGRPTYTTFSKEQIDRMF
jgi:DNA mismatch repair protein MutL